MCMAESLHYSPETIIVLIGYTPIQNVLGVKKIKIKKKMILHLANREKNTCPVSSEHFCEDQMTWM